ncbi:MAG: hypothetical protein RIB63_13340 [Fulvivirga sp.]
MAEQTQENQNQKSPVQTPPKKSNRNTVIVVILAVIVIAQAIKIYIDH